MIKNLLKKLKKSGNCNCGKMERCPRVVKVGDNGGFEVENHFGCRGIQEFNSKLNKWFKNEK
jgi:hypothetical protein